MTVTHRNHIQSILEWEEGESTIKKERKISQLKERAPTQVDGIKSGRG